MKRSFGDHRGVDIQQITRDDWGRWMSVEVSVGWYQDIGGRLYHYDGVIWDEVPSERIEKLEYLG